MPWELKLALQKTCQFCLKFLTLKQPNKNWHIIEQKRMIMWILHREASVMCLFRRPIQSHTCCVIVIVNFCDTKRLTPHYNDQIIKLGLFGILQKTSASYHINSINYMSPILVFTLGLWTFCLRDTSPTVSIRIAVQLLLTAAISTVIMLFLLYMYNCISTQTMWNPVSKLSKE